MTSQITPLPDPPSRSTQDRQEFVIATDNWLLAIQTFTLEANVMALEMDADAASVATAVTTATSAADRAEAAAAARVSFAVATWVNLTAIVGTYAGQSAGVFNDGGTHTDPVVGGTVNNAGAYGWSVSPAGWKRVGDLNGGAVAWASITGKPSTFAPSAHTHAQSDITGLSTSLAGKAATGAVGSTGITMTSGRLLGRTTASAGAIEEITLGVGLSMIAGVLSYTGSTDMVYPASGIAVSTGSAWGTSLAVPAGGLVGLTASQTITNKILTAPTINGGTDTTSKTGGSIQAGVTVNDTGGVVAASPGYRGLPVQTATTRTLVAADAGKVVTASGTVTVPSGLPVGFSCSIVNTNSSAISVAQGSGVTMYPNGVNTTGTVSLAGRGQASVTVYATNTAIVSGPLS